MQITTNKTGEKTHFKDRLYKFTLSLIRFVENLPNNKTTNVISNQLLRSGTSVVANYTEAYASSSKKDYTNFFHHSLKSANESKLWLSLLRDTGNGSKSDIAELLDELDEICRIFGASLLTLKGKR